MCGYYLTEKHDLVVVIMSIGNIPFGAECMEWFAIFCSPGVSLILLARDRNVTPNVSREIVLMYVLSDKLSELMDITATCGLRSFVLLPK